MDYLYTERARNSSSCIHDLLRICVRLHAPVHLKMPAMIRTGTFANLLSQKLARQSNLNPSSIPRNKEEHIGGYGLKVYGQHVLDVTVADSTRKSRTSTVSILAANIDEDLVFRTEWLSHEDVILDMGKDML